MTVALQPLQDRVLVSLRPLPKKTGLIHRVDRQEYAMTADVLAIGPEVRDVKQGDVVLVSSLAGQQVGENLLISESSIIGFVEEC